MPYSKEQVYRSENFTFATFDPERGKPTLYFRTNHGSGRIRQVHKSGPLVQEIRKHYSHAFFHTKENAKSFYNKLVRNKTTRREFRELRKSGGGTNRPIAGHYHVEGHFDKHEETGILIGRHPSGGKVYKMEVNQAYVAAVLASAIKGQAEHERQNRKV